MTAPLPGPAGRQEFWDLEEFARASKLDAWDMAFYSERLW